MRLRYQANRDGILEQMRKYREANKEKMAEQLRRRNEPKKDEISKYQRNYREVNKERMTELYRKYHEANKEKIHEQQRRKHRRKAFTKEDGSSFQAWLASLKNPAITIIAIAKLTPDPGQTLAELIHELSGYAMDVCEQIANPTVIEDSPALTPPPAPDLF